MHRLPWVSTGLLSAVGEGEEQCLVYISAGNGRLSEFSGN